LTRPLGEYQRASREIRGWVARSDALFARDRVERYSIEPDYALHVHRTLVLRATPRAPREGVQVFPTGWSKRQSAPRRGNIEFSVEAADGRGLLAVLDEDEASRKTMLVQLREPLRSRSEVTLEVKWVWPAFWAPLRRELADFINLTLSQETPRVALELRCHRDVPLKELVLSHTLGPRTDVEDGDYRVTRWEGTDVPPNEYRLDLTLHSPSAPLHGAGSSPPRLARGEGCEVFLAHNSLDKDVVRAVAEMLWSAHGVRAWFDEWDLVAGDDIVPTIEAALDASAAGAVFFGANGLGPFHGIEVRRIATHFRTARKRVIPVCLDGVGAPDLPLFLDQLLAVPLPAPASADFGARVGQIAAGIRARNVTATP